MAIAEKDLRAKLETLFNPQAIEIIDTMGDQDHYAVTITSDLFFGKTRVQQHKMVYDHLGPLVGTTLHALSLKTKTPVETEKTKEF